MKRWLLILCLGIFSVYSYAEQKVLSSTIKAVTVYTDRASVTRQAEISLPAGEHELLFKNLPVQLDNNSVQVNVLSTVPSTVSDVTTKQEARLIEANLRLQKIDEEIIQLNNQIKEFSDQEKLLANQQEFIKKMQESVLAPSKDSSRPSAQELKSIMQFSKETLETILGKRRAITDQKRIVNERLTKLKNERHPLAQEKGYRVKDISVRVNLQQAGKVNVVLTYVTPNATWYPLYDARFDRQANKLLITYVGIVAQRTGEDWKDVKLTLSTAKPRLGGDVPILAPWLIDQAKVMEARQRVSSPMLEVSAPILKESAPPMLMKKVKAKQQMATVNTELTSASFNIDKPLSLNSDGSQQRVTITELNLPHKLNYMTVPKSVAAIYLQAAGTNDSDFPLLAGKLNIFMDNRFITTSRLKTTMPKEELTLDLGVDEGITVTYKSLKRFTEKTGLTGGYNKITYEYLLTIQNNKKTSEIIKVFDQIPVSQDEKITVELLSPNAKTVKHDKEGVISWDWVLNPHEKKEVIIKFSLEYPSDMSIMGL